MDYGTKVTEVYRQLGVKGAKPADLPVVQSSKFELVINAQLPGIADLQPAIPWE